MSLDVYLQNGISSVNIGTGIFIRKNGETIELSLDEARKLYPDKDIDEYCYESDYFYSANITHNLSDMAYEAGIYEAIWRPYRLKNNYMQVDDYDKEYEFEYNNIVIANEIIPYLEKGLDLLVSKPDYFKQFNSPNGWGRYENFVIFVSKYLDACKQYPNSIVTISR